MFAWLWDIFLIAGTWVADSLLGHPIEVGLDWLASLFNSGVNVSTDPTVIGHVVVDKTNQLVGTFSDWYKVAGTSPTTSAEQHCSLYQPQMYRDSVNSINWKLNPDLKDILLSCVNQWSS